MLKNKKQLAVGALFCSALFAPIVGIGTVYADGAEITINGGTEDLYVETGSESSTDGTATYDAETGVLTLNNYNGGGIYATGLEELIIMLEGENVISMSELESGFAWYGIGAPDAIIDIEGTGSLKIDESDRTTSWGASSSAILAGHIEIGHDDASEPIIDILAPTRTCLFSSGSWTSSRASGSITIFQGDLKLSCNAAMQAYYIGIVGGNTEINGILSSTSTLSTILRVYGGVLTVNGKDGLGSNVTLNKAMFIEGGVVNINNGQYGIHFTDLSGTAPYDVNCFLITGGELNINNVEHGIRLEDGVNSSSEDDVVDGSFISFDGGTTRINAKYGAVEAFYDDDNNDKSILMTEDMILYPSGLSVELDVTEYTSTRKEYKYYLAANGSAATSVIITDDESAIEIEDDDEEESDIVVPNTGSFTSDHKGLIVGISAVVISLVSIIAYLSRYTLNRQKSKVHFGKK